MKVTIAIFLMLFSLKVTAQLNVKVSDFNKLNWLEGTWYRTNAKPGRSTIETWTKVSENSFQGTSVYMKDNDTTLVEKMKIITKDGGIHFVADVPENKSEVYFKLTELSDNGFICENPKHDFPKKISYKKEGKTLNAVISGDGKSVEYIFEKR